MVRKTIHKYHARERIGETLQRWMSDPSSSTLQACKVQRSNVKFEDVGRLAFEREKPYHPVQLEDFGIEPLKKEEWNKLSIVETEPHGPVPRKELNVWEGLITAGILVIEEIKRTSGFYTSEISQAVYENFFPLNMLKQIFVLDVENLDTLGFVSRRLYSRSNGLQWPDETIRYWEYDTPEFKALLGTKIGQVVANIVLGAFDRGSRRIVRIGTAFMFDFLQMRFEIQEILPALPQVTEEPIDQRAGPDLERKQRMADWIEFFKGFLPTQCADSSNALQPVKDPKSKHRSIDKTKENLSQSHKNPRKRLSSHGQSADFDHNNDLHLCKGDVPDPISASKREDRSVKSGTRSRGVSSVAKTRKKRRIV